VAFTATYEILNTLSVFIKIYTRPDQVAGKANILKYHKLRSLIREVLCQRLKTFEHLFQLSQLYDEHCRAQL